MYYLKIIPWLLAVGPTGLRPPSYFVFPEGYQELWLRVVKQLDVHCSSEVTGIKRTRTANGTKVQITVNGEEAVYDWIILATPPSAIRRYLDMTAEEKELLDQTVSHKYRVTVAKVGGLASDQTTIYPYANSRPQAAGHVNVWYDPAPGQPIFVTYQNPEESQSEEDVRHLLASDFAALGRHGREHSFGTRMGLLRPRPYRGIGHRLL